MVKHEKQAEPNELDAVDNGRELPPANVRSAPAKLSQGALIGIASVVAIATGALGFVGGMQFQKGSASSGVANQRNGFGGGQGMGMRNGSFGEVTAVSDSSITIAVRNFRQNSSSQSRTTKTYTINSSTTITVDGSTGKVGDIATGETVMIEADSSDSSIAASIRVGMGGMPGQGQTQSTTNDSASSPT